MATTANVPMKGESEKNVPMMDDGGCAEQASTPQSAPRICRPCRRGRCVQVFASRISHVTC